MGNIPFYDVSIEFPPAFVKLVTWWKKQAYATTHVAVLLFLDKLTGLVAVGVKYFDCSVKT